MRKAKREEKFSKLGCLLVHPEFQLQQLQVVAGTSLIHGNPVVIRHDVSGVTLLVGDQGIE